MDNVLLPCCAGPDVETLEQWIIDRFRVDPDMAEASLRESVRSMMPKPRKVPP